jgi:hypothetical protein
VTVIAASFVVLICDLEFMFDLRRFLIIENPFYEERSYSLKAHFSAKRINRLAIFAYLK